MAHPVDPLETRGKSRVTFADRFQPEFEACFNSLTAKDQFRGVHEEARERLEQMGMEFEEQGPIEYAGCFQEALRSWNLKVEKSEYFYVPTLITEWRKIDWRPAEINSVEIAAFLRTLEGFWGDVGLPSGEEFVQQLPWYVYADEYTDKTKTYIRVPVIGKLVSLEEADDPMLNIETTYRVISSLDSESRVWTFKLFLRCEARLPRRQAWGVGARSLNRNSFPLFPSSSQNVAV